MVALHDAPAKAVVTYACQLNEDLLQLSIRNLGDYLAYRLNWHVRQARRWDKCADVRQATAPIHRKEQLQQDWPQHFTRINVSPYISNELTSHLLLEKWLADNKQFLLESPPLQPITQ